MQKLINLIRKAIIFLIIFALTFLTSFFSVVSNDKFYTINEFNKFISYALIFVCSLWLSILIFKYSTKFPKYMNENDKNKTTAWGTFIVFIISLIVLPVEHNYNIIQTFIGSFVISGIFAFLFIKLAKPEFVMLIESKMYAIEIDDSVIVLVAIILTITGFFITEMSFQELSFCFMSFIIFTVCLFIIKNSALMFIGLLIYFPIFTILIKNPLPAFTISFYCFFLPLGAVFGAKPLTESQDEYVEKIVISLIKIYFLYAILNAIARILLLPKIRTLLSRYKGLGGYFGGGGAGGSF